MRVVSIADVDTKLCHARPGHIVKFPVGSDSVADFRGTYVVCLVQSDKPAKGGFASAASAGLRSSGLYACERDVLLLDVETGVLTKPPSLSVRCDIYRNAQLHLYAPPAQAAAQSQSCDTSQ